MKYEEPNMQILLLVEEDFVRTSSLTADPTKVPNVGDDEEAW